jgi:hypothetical protein
MRLDQRAKRIEEPSVTVQLLLVLLLEAEQDLDRTGSWRHLATVGNDDVGCVPATRRSVNRDTRSLSGYELKDMGCDIPSSDRVFRDTFLVAAHLNCNVRRSATTEVDVHVRTRLSTWSVLLLTLLRPSDTMHTTTFFHPSGPQVFDRVRPQRWAMFLMTLQNLI